MRKFIIISGITLIVISTFLYLDFYYFDLLRLSSKIDDYRTERWAIQEFGIRDGELIDFQLYERYEVDTGRLRGYFKVVEGTPFTHFFQMANINQWEQTFNYVANNIIFSGFNFETSDFQNKCLAISFGREIAEMRRDGPFVNVGFFVAVTFAEEYQGDVMFLYIMDEFPLYLHTANSYFIMDGTERVFLGGSYTSLYEQYSD